MTGKRRRIHPPSLAELEAMAALDGLDLREGEGAQLLGIVTALVEAAAAAEERETIRLGRRPGRRDPGGRPAAGDDPYNAFVRRCRVEGAGDGPLAGRTVAVKDNIAVGGVPMTEGTFFPAWTPAEDAVVVERILDAGGTIVGTLNMDELGGGATGVMSSIGPARNPVDPGALGRRVVGRGRLGGPVGRGRPRARGRPGWERPDPRRVLRRRRRQGDARARAVARRRPHRPHHRPRDAAGAQRRCCRPPARGRRRRRLARSAMGPGRDRDRALHAADGAGVGGMRIGVVEESVTGVECEPAVTAGLDRAVEALESAGATVERFSLPIWSDGFATYQPLVAHLIANMIRSEGAGYGHLGYLDVDRLHAFAVARRAGSAELNPYVKCWLLADRFLHERYHNVSYGTLQNQRLLVRRRISEALGRWDLLLTPDRADGRAGAPPAGATIDELLAHSPESVAFNTAPLNLSGHPALSVPTEWGRDGALPTAVQLIAPHFREHEAFRAAFVLEAALGPFA